ncbi:DUF368 domain-containing protein [Corynebacterium sp.]|uniref:DUF368 domain-containing protein n=1 Tax=Corynebacterium sp. TaxID=1720 RepID=UPI0026DC5E27|nr:DUF368 domain-containing protein [Corynebacterium sp.]MDO5031785.1 DUF368 domain-containing protein [Corynebacterium sp.]
MHFLLNALRGALIGMAELVPGISGGTVALIVGIYERALRNANDLISGRFKKVEWSFLAAIAVGMLAAVFGASSILHSFVENQVSASRALFMGMVTVSIVVPVLMMSTKFRAPNIIAFLVAAAAVFFITGYTSTPVENPPLYVVFLAAMVAICALILPGISGSLILLTLGLYQYVIGAVSDRNMLTLGVFALGALCGLALFVKALNYLLDNHRDATLAAMAGFMVGSLRALWPWGDHQDASTPTILLLFLLGAAIVGIFVYFDARKSHAYEEKHA